MESIGTLTYGVHTVDVDALPVKSVQALVRRGLSHLLGNETASKVASFVESQEGEVSDEVKASKKAEFQAAALEALANGTIGDRASGPRGGTVEGEMRKIARTEVENVLAENKLSFPTGDKVVEFGDGQKLTGRELIDRRLAKHGDRIRKAAEKNLANKAKQGAAESLTDL